MTHSLDLFAHEPRNIELDPDAMLLGGFAESIGTELLKAIQSITSDAPLRQTVTPGGLPMSVTMTNCGDVGWISDRHGYRYGAIDTHSGQPWPAMPPLFTDLATRAAAAAGFPDFEPDACLINCYLPGARMSLHQDKNERDFSKPIVSVSLGLSATFLWGGQTRNTRTRRIVLTHGDVVVWGGAARKTFHGVLPLADDTHPLTGHARYNLTLRSAR